MCPILRPAPAYMDIIRVLRPAVNGLPLMALGRITDPAEAEGILARGEAELIGLGRALVADPAWLTRRGVAARTTYATACRATPAGAPSSQPICQLPASITHASVAATRWTTCQRWQTHGGVSSWSAPGSLAWRLPGLPRRGAMR